MDAKSNGAARAPILSICIPTRGRTEILKNTLENILKSDAERDSYEIAIADNSPSDETERMLAGVEARGVRLVYRRAAADGFMNSINALSLGTGELLKLHNNYTMFREGALRTLVSYAYERVNDKPVTLFTDGNLGCGRRRSFSSFDSFIAASSYFNSWSTAFSVWRTDFHSIMEDDPPLNPMFPHTALLLACKNASSYCIDDAPMFINQDVPNKGGYNLFRVFAVDYLGMISASTRESGVSSKTFNRIRRDMMRKFFPEWYWRTMLSPNGYTFELDGIRESMSIHFNAADWVRMLIGARLFGLRMFVRGTAVSMGLLKKG